MRAFEVDRYIDEKLIVDCEMFRIQ